MIYGEKVFALKDGRMAVFRSPTEDDADELSAMVRTRVMETNYFVRRPEECESSEQEVAVIRFINGSARSMMIVCEIEGKIAGNGELRREPFEKTAHRANISVGLLRPYWGLGLGTMLLREMIGKAKEIGVRQLELHVIEGNERAMVLYRKTGFVTVGEHPNFVRLEDGTLLREYLMALSLET